MKAAVVDTNVPVVANGKSPQADDVCVLACIDALDAARQGIVVLDDGNLILDEYFNKLSRSGQPGVGDEFAKWVWDRQADSRCCERVRITPKVHDQGNFKEFPEDPDLAKFDRSDRKFVAVARVSRRSPTVLNAVDRDWWGAREVLARHGVKVEFLCPQAMPRKSISPRA